MSFSKGLLHRPGADRPHQAPGADPQTSPAGADRRTGTAGRHAHHERCPRGRRAALARRWTRPRALAAGVSGRRRAPDGGRGPDRAGDPGLARAEPGEVLAPASATLRRSADAGETESGRSQVRPIRAAGARRRGRGGRDPPRSSARASTGPARAGARRDRPALEVRGMALQGGQEFWSRLGPSLALDQEHRHLPAARRRRPGAARPRGRVCVRAARAPRSALVTTATSGISTMPAFMYCRLSPEPGWTASTTVSTSSAISVSDWPTPTVSTSTTSYSARISTMAAAHRSARPPRRPAGRHRADEDALVLGSLPSIRVRSPSSAPPVRREDGSTAITPTVRPPRAPPRRPAPRPASTCRRPGGPVRPMTLPPRRRPGGVEQGERRRASAPPRWPPAPGPGPACRRRAGRRAPRLKRACVGLQRRLRRRQPGDRHAVGRAGDVVEARRARRTRPRPGRRHARRRCRA